MFIFVSMKSQKVYFGGGWSVSEICKHFRINLLRHFPDPEILTKVKQKTDKQQDVHPTAWTRTLLICTLLQKICYSRYSIGIL